MSYRVVVSLVASNCRCHCRPRYDTRAKKEERRRKEKMSVCLALLARLHNMNTACVCPGDICRQPKWLCAPHPKVQELTVLPFSWFAAAGNNAKNCLITVSSFIIIIHHHHTTTVVATAAAGRTAKGTVQHGWLLESIQIESNRCRTNVFVAENKMTA
jgi:hypothetical protein